MCWSGKDGVEGIDGSNDVRNVEAIQEALELNFSLSEIRGGRNSGKDTVIESTVNQMNSVERGTACVIVNTNEHSYECAVLLLDSIREKSRNYYEDFNHIFLDVSDISEDDTHMLTDRFANTYYMTIVI